MTAQKFHLINGETIYLFDTHIYTNVYVGKSPSGTGIVSIPFASVLYVEDD